MKRIFLAAIAAAALLAGCAKSEDAPEARKLNVVFSVADKDSYGADTKAVKQGWSVNDEILIVFESEMNDWLNPSVNDNTNLHKDMKINSLQGFYHPKCPPRLKI